MTPQTQCSACDGQGWTSPPATECKPCRGTGKRKRPKRMHWTGLIEHVAVKAGAR